MLDESRWSDAPEQRPGNGGALEQTGETQGNAPALPGTVCSSSLCCRWAPVDCQVAQK